MVSFLTARFARDTEIAKKRFFVFSAERGRKDKDLMHRESPVFFQAFDQTRHDGFSLPASQRQRKK